MRRTNGLIILLAFLLVVLVLRNRMAADAKRAANVRAEQDIAAAEATRVRMEEQLRIEREADEARDTKEAKAAQDAVLARQLEPYPKSAHVPFYTLVERKDMIMLGHVHEVERDAEGLSVSCATLRGRKVEFLDPYGALVTVRYTASEPREHIECPTGTSYYVDAEAYRAMEAQYLGSLNDEGGR